MKKLIILVTIVALGSLNFCSGTIKNMSNIDNAEGEMMETLIGLEAASSKKIAGYLNKLLADEYVFLVKLLKYHWNITGPHFFSLHKLLDDQYKEVFKMIDEIAERTRSLGYQTLGTLTEFEKESSLKEHPGKFPAAFDMVKDLVLDHEAIIKSLRSQIPEIEELTDFGTMDFLTKLMEQHEKMAWFLRAHLQK